jgi:hypothetical protein
MLVADLELALQDVPDLGEVVPVAGVVGARRVANETGVGLGGALGPRMEHHLAVLTRPPQRLPRLLIGDTAQAGRRVQAFALSHEAKI